MSVKLITNILDRGGILYKKADKVSLDVENDNPAMKLYRNLGFEVVNKESFSKKNLVMAVNKKDLIYNLESFEKEIELS